MVSSTFDSHAVPQPRGDLSAAADSGARDERAMRGSDGDAVADATARQTILLVDDDADIREALSETLEEYGYSVITAAHGADAIRRLHSMTSPPTFILLDLMMPIMDGYTFLDERRKDPLLGSIPVAVITAGHGVDRDRLGNGTPIIPKPIKVPQLMNILRGLQPGGTAT
jgi:CheY-like chemotaxis protein